MSDFQLSFLTTEPTSFDINAVDDGFVRVAIVGHEPVATVLTHSSVDDWVFGLGFTNWKSVIDHALLTGHFELYESEGDVLGLRKHGYRYSPIPRLPVAGGIYVQQRLLAVAAERKLSPGRHERMVSLSIGDLQHKCVIEAGVCDLTVKQNGVVVRAAIQIEDLDFCGAKLNGCDDLATQMCRILKLAGAQEGELLDAGAKSLALYILRVVQGVR
jgi:hypothetical protein